MVVDNVKGADSDTCGTSANPQPCKTVAAGLSRLAAAGGGTLQLAAGGPAYTCSGGGSGSRLVISHAMSIVGGNGCGSAQPVLDCAWASAGFYLAPAAVTVSLENLHIANAVSSQPGGAIFADEVSLVMRCSTVTGSLSTQEWATWKNPPLFGAGGAVAVFNANVTIDRVTFSNNSAHGSGGALGLVTNRPISGTSHSIIQSTFEDNSATYGGAIFDFPKQYGDITLQRYALRMENIKLIGNRGTVGGAAYLGCDGPLNGYTLTLLSSTAHNNSAFLHSTHGKGGAFKLEFIGPGGDTAGARSIDINFTNSSFVANGAAQGGAIHVKTENIVSRFSLRASLCSFVDNYARPPDSYDCIRRGRAAQCPDRVLCPLQRA